MARAANFAARRGNDERLREEMEAHLAMLAEENLRAGMTPVEAGRQAVLGVIGVVLIVLAPAQAAQRQSVSQSY